jgi:hypothetical protein
VFDRFGPLQIADQRCKPGSDFIVPIVWHIDTTRWELLWTCGAVRAAWLTPATVIYPELSAPIAHTHGQLSAGSRNPPRASAASALSSRNRDKCQSKLSELQLIAVDQYRRLDRPAVDVTSIQTADIHDA